MYLRFAILITTICWSSLSACSQTYLAPPTEVVSVALASFAEYDTGQSADEILALGGTAGINPNKPVIFARSVDPDGRGGIFGSAKNTYPSAHIVSLVGRSDFVGVGTPLARWTFPLPKHSFAISIYLVEIAQIGLPGRDGFVPGAQVYIARAGGPFTINNRYFRAIDPEFQLFHLNEPYLFFGTRIAGSLLKVDAEQVLKLNGQSLHETSTKHQYLAFYQSRTLPDIFSEVVAASASLSVPNRGAK